MQGAFFYSGILAFASGVFLRSFFEIGWVMIAWLSFVALVMGLWWYKNRTQPAGPGLMLGLILLSCCIGGITRVELVTTGAAPSDLESKLGQKIELAGVVVAEPEITEKSTRLVVVVENERVLVSTDRYAQVVYGDQILFTGKLQQPESFETEFGRTFNYPGYLAVRDIFYTVSFAQIEVTDHNQANSILAFLFTLKAKFLSSMQQYIPEPAVGLAAGLLLGVKSSLGEEIEEAFRATGIIHIVVLSGANIMLVVIFVMYMLALVLPVRSRALLGIVAIVLFALLVGLSATVVRASIMAVLILLALVLGRRYNILRALCFAGVVMSLINPLLLVYDVGFQLSFLATLGLILVAPQFESILQGVSPWFKIKEFFIATLATQIAILPLLLFHIGQFSVLSVLVNVLILPVVPLAMLTSFITGVVGFLVPALATLCGIVAYGFLTYIIQLALWFAELPFATFIVPTFPFPVMVGAYVIIGYYFYKLQRRLVHHGQQIDYSSIADWIVVDEETYKAGIGQKERPATERSISSDPVTPIFFR